MNLNQIIKKCKKLINLPYNHFNLDNYQNVLSESYNIIIGNISTNSNGPIKLMSGDHPKAGIIHSHSFSNKSYKRNIYIVGKGVLFDAGGYNLKSEMSTMKTDMAGMAAAFAVAAHIGKNIIAYCPIATNFIHNNQIVPGDILTIKNKKIEITNSDAEGRLILAESLSMLNPKRKDIIITIATLTGAVSEAIGSKATGVFSMNPKLARLYLEASKEERELAWKLPMWDYLQKKFNKKIIQNSFDDDGGEVFPGATMGAMFIRQFIRYPNNWIHLDIGGSAFDDKRHSATGMPIRSLVNFIEKLNKEEK